MTGSFKPIEKEKSFYEKVSDICFCLWLFCALFFERTRYGQLSLALFVFAVASFMLFRDKAFDKNERYYSAVNFYFVSYVLLLGYIFITTRYTGNILSIATANRMFKTLCINFVFFYVLYKYMIMKENIDSVCNLYLLTGIIISVAVLLLSVSNILGGRLGTEIGVNGNSIAMLCVNCIVILLYKNAKEKRSTYWIVILSLLVIILFTGSRKGIIGVAAGIFLYSVIGNEGKKLKNITLSLVLVGIVYFLIMNVGALYDIIGVRVEELLSLIAGDSFEEASLTSRNNYVQLGWKMILENPWFGYGVDCFRELRGAYGTYSHNNYIELLFGVGIWGTIIYYSAYIYILSGHIKLYKKQKRDISKFFIVMMLVQMVLEYAYVSYYSRQNILFVIIALAAYKIIKKDIESEERIQCPENSLK